MGYTPNQIQSGVVAYLDKEFMPMIPSEPKFQRVIAGTAIALAIKKYFGMADQIKEMPIVKNLGIVGEDGTFDLETLSEAFKKQLPKDGLPMDVPMLGTITIHEADVDKLYEYIKSSK